MSIIHGIVESYGGKIFVESTVNRGTIFIVYLPATKEIVSETSNVLEHVPTGNERILLVDDEVHLVGMAQNILERLGYQVTARTSSVEAKKLFQMKPLEFDLVITDMTMPNITGDKLAKELLEIRPDIPVILCTGYSNKIDHVKAKDIGINAFIYKPIAKNDLAKIVRKVLDGTH